VSWEADSRIDAIVKDLAGALRDRARLRAGLQGDAGIDAVIRDYIADEGVRAQ